MSAPQSNEVRQAPRHHPVNRQGQLDLVDMPQLQGFHPTAIFEDIEKCFVTTQVPSMANSRETRLRRVALESQGKCLEEIGALLVHISLHTTHFACLPNFLRVP